MSWRNDHLLFDFLLLEMPAPKVKRDGFMDIADIQYHENTITRIYAYFLNLKKNKAVSILFLDSLLQVAKPKSKKALKFDNHFCQIERQTDKGNRIDLLIKSGAEEFAQDDCAIIIENKIFSGVSNDLMDYWSSIKLVADNKIGVLLTLQPTTIPPVVANYFINITHREWLMQIKNNGLPYDLDSHTYVYINDFIRNMENILQTTEGINDDASFFFDNTTKVLRAMQTYDAAWAHVVNQIKVLGEKLGLGIYGNSAGWRHLWDYKSHVYYVISLEQALKPNPQITIFLEVYKDGIPRRDEMRTLLTEHGYYKRLRDDNKSTQSWAHLAYQDYPLTKANIENLAQYLFERMQQDFGDAYQLVEKRLVTNNDHDMKHLPTNNAPASTAN